jgi:hypothetical protein
MPYSLMYVLISLNLIQPPYFKTQTALVMQGSLAQLFTT